MENTIKYSILIPVYNTEKYVERCLESIFAQDTKSNYEIIVCDDGSTDHSYEIISKYKNVKLLQNRINQRGVITRNKLIRQAQGEYIVWIDSDDTIEKNFLSTMDEKLKEKKYDIIETSFNFIFNNEVTVNALSNKNLHLNNCLDVFWNLPYKFMLWRKIIKREIMIKTMPPDIFAEFDDVFFTMPIYYYCKDYLSIQTPLYNHYGGIGYWSSSTDMNYFTSFDRYKKILLTRKNEFVYNANFLKVKGLYEQYKYNLLHCCDFDTMFLYLIKIQNLQQRKEALDLLQGVFNIQMLLKNEIYPF